MIVRLTAFAAALCLVFVGAARAEAPALNPVGADFVMRDVHFASGEVLPQLRLHYATLGTPKRDAAGRITNAVLLLHGTGGTGLQFMRAQFAGELFGPGQLLDVARYYIILPDDIGHGGSSKPSDGLHARFPHYDYADMVEAEHRLVTEHLGVARLRLILGTSMGCMHAFMWGEAWPEAMDALMPLACLPTAIAGRNRAWRAMVIDAIRSDPDWKGGDYTAQPTRALRTAQDLLSIAGSAPHQMQITLPTREAADAWAHDAVTRAMAELDANDLMYQVDSSRTYDPSAGLERITARVTWINSADDFINPPELGLAETFAPRLKHGRYILLPIGPTTHGHGTHTWAVNWKGYLAELLAQ